MGFSLIKTQTKKSATRLPSSANSMIARSARLVELSANGGENNEIAPLRIMWTDMVSATPVLQGCVAALCISASAGLVSLSIQGVGSPGWGGRIRTSAWGNQNPLPYHLATPQQSQARHPEAGLGRGSPGPASNSAPRAVYRHRAGVSTAKAGFVREILLEYQRNERVRPNGAPRRQP